MTKRGQAELAELAVELARALEDGAELTPAEMALAKRVLVRAGRAKAGVRFDAMYPEDGEFRRELYPRHMEFYRAGRRYRERCMFGGNRVGKTLGLLYEDVCHLTGKYPSWWAGRVFEEPVDCWVSGKAFPVGSMLPTPRGLRAMGSLQGGDQVFGPDGLPVRVTGVYPQGRRDLFRLHLRDGTAVDCDGEHLWRVRMRDLRSGQCWPWEVRTTRELHTLTPMFRWELPERPMLMGGRAADTLVDPYVLGCLLGDGTLRGKDSMVALTTADDEVLFELLREAKRFGCRLNYQRSDGKSRTWRVVWGRGKKPKGNPFLRALRELGVANCRARTKFVPRLLLDGPVETRLAVLQGLMDTDGTACQQGSASFSTVSGQLARDVVELARSLGMNARMAPKHRKSGFSWHVGLWRGDLCPFRLRRKKERWGKARGWRRKLLVDWVEVLGDEDECVCIKVDRDDGLFVGPEHVVTHNTSETTKDILQDGLFGDVRKTVRGRNELTFTGMVPREFVIEGSEAFKAGLSGVLQRIQFRYRDSRSEYSTLGFKAYEQGRGSFEGTTKHLIHFDEEPGIEVYNEALIRTGTVDGIVITGFTPLEGMTETVIQFMEPQFRPPEDEDVEGWEAR